MNTFFVKEIKGPFKITRYFPGVSIFLLPQMQLIICRQEAQFFDIPFEALVPYTVVPWRRVPSMYSMRIKG